MSDIAAFLLARYEDAEALTRAAVAEMKCGCHPDLTSDRWEAAPQGGVLVDNAAHHSVVEATGWGDMGDASAQHVAANDPAAVLRDIEAKRKIVETFAVADKHHEEYRRHVAEYVLVREAQTVRDQLYQVMRFLAEPYDYREDYDPSWRP